jgi:transposase-like protein
MTFESRDSAIDERMIELIADRVAAVLRKELEAIAAALIKSNGSERLLTVDDVAERFGVARSTVYAHWREWGGYKLGQSDKAPIRFEGAGLPATHGSEEPHEPTAAPRPSRRRRRDLLSDAPRLDHSFEELG